MKKITKIDRIFLSKRFNVCFKVFCAVGASVFLYHILSLYIEVARFLFNNW